MQSLILLSGEFAPQSSLLRAFKAGSGSPCSSELAPQSVLGGLAMAKVNGFGIEGRLHLVVPGCWFNPA